MNFFIVSIFPEIYESFINTSLIQKSISNDIIKFEFVNPRNFTEDKHRQVDDEIYGGGKGMLMKAKPVIDAVESILNKLKTENGKQTKCDHDYSGLKIIYLAPSEEIFDQQKAFEYSKLENIIFVCGRYEGIDHRFELYFEEKYKNVFEKISLGKFILLGGETANMVIIEAISRLIPGVIKETESFIDESYNPSKNMSNIEYPQYTRPEDLYGMKVPEILLSGHHKKIKDWKDNNEKYIS